MTAKAAAMRSGASITVVTAGNVPDQAQRMVAVRRVLAAESPHAPQRGHAADAPRTAGAGSRGDEGAGPQIQAASDAYTVSFCHRPTSRALPLLATGWGRPGRGHPAYTHEPVPASAADDGGSPRDVGKQHLRSRSHEPTAMTIIGTSSRRLRNPARWRWPASGTVHAE